MIWGERGLFNKKKIRGKFVITLNIQIRMKEKEKKKKKKKKIKYILESFSAFACANLVFASDFAFAISSCIAAFARAIFSSHEARTAISSRSRSCFALARRVADEIEIAFCWSRSFCVFFSWFNLYCSHSISSLFALIPFLNSPLY